jgi:cytochrome bd-type quinol oxidase subunit 1
LEKHIKQNAGWALAGAALFVVLLTSFPAAAQQENEYRQIIGLDSRKVIWFLAQMHLFFGAFVLGVPLFAVIIEIVGWKGGDKKFDKLAYEFTSLLSVAYATTAAFGGLLAFALFTLYPTFMGYMAGTFKDVMFIYALLFFAETFALYLYYYGWGWLSNTTPFSAKTRWILKSLGVAVIIVGVLFFFGAFGFHMRGDTRSFMTFLYVVPLGIGLYIIRDAKSSHIFIGIVLNIVGTGIMQAANSMAGFMMSPAGVSETGQLIGSVWVAFENVLATPIAIHRMLGNLAFGGLVAGSYAAVKFIGAKTPQDKAHYDWMGYIANFVAIAALIPLPFAGYYLGRELYSHSAVMGNNMMGGDFSWTFIIQALLVGSLFLISNYYLWSGMTRIPGAERYYKFIKFILFALILSFAVWLTPHNLPLTGHEVSDMGGSQYHPTLKFLGLMPAKNAVINLIILSTFFSFLLYRRGNKTGAVSISEDRHFPGRTGRDRHGRPVRAETAADGSGRSGSAGGPGRIFPHRRVCAGVRVRHCGCRGCSGAQGPGQAGAGALYGSDRLQRGDLPGRLWFHRDGASLAVPAQRRGRPVPATDQLPDSCVGNRCLPVQKRQGSRPAELGQDDGLEPVRASSADLHHYAQYGTDGIYPVGSSG